MSKGDIVLEPLELLVEAVGKFVVKVVARAISNEPIGEWGPSEWLIVIGMGLVLLASIWMIRRKISERSERGGKRKRKQTI